MRLVLVIVVIDGVSVNVIKVVLKLIVVVIGILIL